MLLVNARSWKSAQTKSCCEERKSWQATAVESMYDFTFSFPNSCMPTNVYLYWEVTILFGLLNLHAPERVSLVLRVVQQLQYPYS